LTQGTNAVVYNLTRDGGDRLVADPWDVPGFEKACDLPRAPVRIRGRSRGSNSALSS